MDVPVEYIAGILDANGLFRVRAVQSGTKLPAVYVHGLHIELLQVLADATGTAVTVIKRDYNGVRCAEHCPERHVHTISVSGRWSVTGAKATVLLHNVLPHLRVQREVAEELLAVGMDAPRKEQTIRKMKKLGWEIP